MVLTKLGLVLVFFISILLPMAANSAPSDLYKAWRKADPSPPPVHRIDPPSVKAPEGSTNSGKLNPTFNDWRSLQAKHAWNQRSDVWRKKGINSQEGLRDLAADIRRSHDEARLLAPHHLHGTPRFAYGRYNSDGKSGILVIDNPGDWKNGGTIMNVKDLRAKINDENMLKGRHGN